MGKMCNFLKIGCPTSILKGFKKNSSLHSIFFQATPYWILLFQTMFIFSIYWGIFSNFFAHFHHILYRSCGHEVRSWVTTLWHHENYMALWTKLFGKNSLWSQPFLEKMSFVLRAILLLKEKKKLKFFLSLMVFFRF